MPKWYTIKSAANSAPAKVSIYDEIGGWGVSAREFVAQWQTLGDSDVELTLHTPGGEVMDGLAIYNAVRAHKGKVTARIDTMALSMGSIIALAADEIEIADNGVYMVHNPWTLAIGDADDIEKVADQMRKWEDVLSNIYVERTGKEEGEIREMMRAETWLHGQEAVDAGFANRTFKAAKIAANWRSKIHQKFRHSPAALVEAANNNAKGKRNMKELLKSLGLNEEASEAAAIEAVNKLKADVQAAQDLAQEQEQAAAKAKADLDSANALIAEAKEAEAVAFVEQSVASGRISAANKTKVLEQAKANLEAVKLIVGAVDLPPVKPEREAPVSQQPNASWRETRAAQIAKQLGGN